MKLVRIFLTLTLLTAAIPAFSMHIGYLIEAVKSPAEKAQEATQELQELSTYTPTSTGESWKIPKIKPLILKGANPNIANANGDYALILAAGQHWPDLVIFLLSNGANPDVQNRRGNTALLETINHTIGLPGYSERKKQIIETLLGYNANPNLRDNDGNSPLSAAIGADKPDLVKLLLDYGANPFETNLAGLSDRALGLQSQNPEIRKLLQRYAIQKLP